MKGNGLTQLFLNLKHYMAKQKHEAPKPEVTTHTEVTNALIRSNEVMKAIKSQFGYSGYSNPNYINLTKAIEDNEKLIEGLKHGGN